MNESRPGQATAGSTILVAEDDPAVQVMIGDLLKAYDFRVLSAADGETALRLAQMHRPDVICLDLGLPGMGGLAAAAALQADPSTRAQPIVAVTGCDVDRETAQAIARLCVAYVPKPFGAQRLLALLRCILGRKPAGDGSGIPSR